MHDLELNWALRFSLNGEFGSDSNHMDIEIELNVALAPGLAMQVRAALDERFELVQWKRAGTFSLRLNAPMATSIDQAIDSFLDSINPLANILRQQQATLRVGAFFSVDEAAAFSVVLSAKTVQAISINQFTVDVTCYPCA